MIVDSDVLIDALRGIEPSYCAVFGALEAGQLETTAVNWLEVLIGARNDEERNAATTLLMGMPVYPFTLRAAELSASVGSQLRAAGNLIPTPDLMLAGVALEHASALLTRNQRDFRRVTGPNGRHPRVAVATRCRGVGYSSATPG